jgi:hypothetical protein
LGVPPVGKVRARKGVEPNRWRIREGRGRLLTLQGLR